MANPKMNRFFNYQSSLEMSQDILLEQVRKNVCPEKGTKRVS